MQGNTNANGMRLPEGLKTGYVTTGKNADSVLGNKATAEGDDTTASEEASHAEGRETTASGQFSHAEGHLSTASSYSAHAEGSQSTASASYSHAEGNRTKASASGAHAEGQNSEASGELSHAEGRNTTASGVVAHAEGDYTVASGESSHAEGISTTASGDYSHAEGIRTTASGDYSHAEGNRTTASGDCSHSSGHYTIAEGSTAYAIGKYNKTYGTAATAQGDYAFVIGNGTSDTAKSNAFRIDWTGATYGVGAFNTSGADYAEMYEWADGNLTNEDRVGYFVTLRDNKISIYSSEDTYLLGAISACPSIVGNAYDDQWVGMYQKDEWGRTIYEYVEEKDEEGNLTWAGNRPVLNPSYQSDQKYEPRSERREWAYVGDHGVIRVRQDGTCQVNAFCYPNGDGIATKSEQGFFVKRVLSDSIVEIVYK